MAQSKKGDLKRMFMDEAIKDRRMREKDWGRPIASMQAGFSTLDIFYRSDLGIYRVVVENINGLRRVDYCRDIDGTYPSSRILAPNDRNKLSVVASNILREAASQAAHDTYTGWVTRMAIFESVARKAQQNFQKDSPKQQALENN